MVGLLDWELWAQAGHVAFECQALVAMDGENVTRRGREFHGQVRGGDDNVDGVERGTVKEDIIGCGCVHDEEADGNGFSLGSVTKYGVKVNVAAGGNLFSKKAIDGFIIRDHGSV